MSDAEFIKALEEHDPVTIKMPFAWASLPREQREPGGYRAVSKGSDWNATLLDGRLIRLSSLRQYHTYAGTLCGLPLDDDVRGWPIERAVSAAAQDFGIEEGEVCILPPYLLRSHAKRGPVERREEIDVDFLPPVCSIGRFDSTRPIHDEDAMGSGVVAVWFQVGFGPPEAGYVTEQVRRIDWPAFARDWSW